MAKEKSSGTIKGGRKRGFPSKRELYQQVSGRIPEIIDRLFELAKSSNEPVAVSASKALLDRVLPTTKAVDLTSDQKPYQVNIISGYLTKKGWEDRPKSKAGEEGVNVMPGRGFIPPGSILEEK